jgi:putative salt-induced outer membrane protein YdiY
MKLLRYALLLLLALVVVVPAMAADEEEELGWKSTAEFGYVTTSGNTDLETLSFGSETIRKWETSSLAFNVGAIRSEQSTRRGIAIGVPGTFTVPTMTEVNADAYGFETRYDHDISENFFWFTGLGWERNRPSGIDERYKSFAGVGNIWRDDEKVMFRTDYALSYTDQEDVVETVDSVGGFAGVRASWKYRHQFSESVRYTNNLTIDYGLEESDNYRGDMVNAVQVAMTNKVALKVSLRWLYNNLPPIETLPLFDADPNLGGVQTGSVNYQLDELDTIFSTSIVINF